ncbi:MAG: hypothetical protein JEZ01_04375 [Labilibaculum sp.]|nr:hypothetical protein [Labilibaculum sp.]MBI9056988.1 hypothetical protein [Labilibaculum sp.]
MRELLMVLFLFFGFSANAQSLKGYILGESIGNKPLESWQSVGGLHGYLKINTQEEIVIGCEFIYMVNIDETSTAEIDKWIQNVGNHYNVKLSKEPRGIENEYLNVIGCNSNVYVFITLTQSTNSKNIELKFVLFSREILDKLQNSQEKINEYDF